MMCPTVVMVGKEVILLSGYRRLAETKTDGARAVSVKIQAIRKLRKSAGENPDAIAFGYVAGRWFPAV